MGYLTIGYGSASGDLSVTSVTATGDVTGSNLVATTSSTTPFLLVGSAPRASVGLIRGPSTCGFYAKPSAGADVRLIGLESDQIMIGDGNYAAPGQFYFASYVLWNFSTGRGFQFYSPDTTNMLWEFNANATGTIDQLTQTSDVACRTLTIRSQAPFAGSTGANRTPGTLSLEVPAADGAGTQGVMNLKVNSANVMVLGHDGSNPTIRINPETAATAGAGGSTLPATPEGFILVNINGTVRKMPYYPVA